MLKEKKKSNFSPQKKGKNKIKNPLPNPTDKVNKIAFKCLVPNPTEKVNQ